ncbi:MAG: cell division protein FtsL [Cypionkella sp.]|jgi:hypothetical protein|nr:cell division protein FtsL [Cypionkella sp.]
MRPVIYVLSFIAILGLGFWAYREHYDTREALREVSALNAEIGNLREALALQRAEWAYLNRPDRLRELSSANFDRLGLMPLEPTQFGDAANLSYPAVQEFFGTIDNSVMVQGQITPEEDPL